MRIHYRDGAIFRLLQAMLALGAFMLTGEERKALAQIITEVRVTDTPQAVAFSPRGTEVAATGFGGAVKIWEPPGSLPRIIQTPNQSTRRAIAFSPDGKLVAAGGDEGAPVQIYDVGTGKCRHTLSGHIGHVLALAFTPDGRTLAATAKQYDKQTQKSTAEICLWDLTTGTRNQKWELPEGSSYSIAYSPDGNALASAGGGNVHIRDAKTGKVSLTLSPDRGGVGKVAFSPDGKQLAGGGGYPVPVKGGTRSVGEFHVWDIDTGKVRLKMTDLPGQVTSVAFSPNGKAIATGSRGPIREKPGMKWVSSEVRLWDAKSGALAWSTEGKLGSVISLAFSPDGDTIVWCDDEVVGITEAATGSQRGTLK